MGIAKQGGSSAGAQLLAGETFQSLEVFPSADAVAALAFFPARGVHTHVAMYTRRKLYDCTDTAVLPPAASTPVLRVINTGVEV